MPAAVGMVFATLYNIVDDCFAGMLSTGEQAGLAITFQVFFILVAFGVGLESAMGALIMRRRRIGVRGLPSSARSPVRRCPRPSP